MKSIHTYLHCMGIALSVLIISVPLMHVQAYQLPESTDTELPTLFPAPGEEGLPLLPQQTMDLPAVTDIVWASILQTEEKDNEIAEMLNEGTGSSLRNLRDQRKRLAVLRDWEGLLQHT